MTHAVETSSKPFEPGTTGWTAADLDDPAIEREWFRGRYEIIEGVLTKMPPAYFIGGESAQNLIFALRDHFVLHGPKGSFATEVDIIVDESRVVVADAAFLTAAQRDAQKDASRRAGKADFARTRILIAPMLIIESSSPGHERHDEQTKRRWYAEFGVEHYWILNAYQRTLNCLKLDAAEYRDQKFSGNDADIRPSAFPGLVIRPSELWPD